MIGTITFHWCTNFGAVVQAFALQTYLNNKGHDCEIIDYVPRRVALIQQFQMVKRFDFNSIRKYNAIKKFRHNWLVTTKHRFNSFSDLMNLSSNYDYIIVGSDQVWNESFTLGGEKGVTLSYFLSFAGTNTKRISYAASFGMNQANHIYVNAVQEELKKFSAISVRENTGVDICNQMGVNAVLVCDPTLLLNAADYTSIIKNVEYEPSDVYEYILHDNQITAWRICEIIKDYFNDNHQMKVTQSIEEWLYRIKNAKIVVTNSFHGLMFSLIFHTDFIVVPVEGSKMNDRIITILGILDLTNRIIDNSDENKIKILCKESINWEIVDQKILLLRKKSEDFLLSSLK